MISSGARSMGMPGKVMVGMGLEEDGSRVEPGMTVWGVRDDK